MATPDIYVTIHGHFYQPPRENPWLGIIERQPSAYPYHDWNEKIATSCYTPNTVSRILDAQGRIDHIINNFAWMSFNIGPTLFHWMAKRLPRTAERIVAGDVESRARNNGHGNAIAQVYNHVIMPLATRREKELQVRWAIADFHRTFGRDPEGMWLAETACNDETIEVLIEHGIRFTILAPSQAERIRPLKSNPLAAAGRAKADKDAWVDVSNDAIDTTQPYRAFLVDAQGQPVAGKHIDLFFFDRPLSTDVSFAHLLTHSDNLAKRLVAAARPNAAGAQLVNVATDGETFGWHEAFADMCLAHFFEKSAAEHALKPVNYARFLEIHPPAWEVELKRGRNGEGTSWSCVHGVDRWKDDCGCTTDSPGWWNQKWRRPLRESFDALRDRVEAIYTLECTPVLKDPEAARDDYVDVVLDRRTDRVEAWLERHAKEDASRKDRLKALRLLEALHNTMLTYTSCGWFFGDLSRLEPVQNLKYALRAVELAQPYTAENLEHVLLEKLKDAPSNIPEMGNGKKVFQMLVKPALFDLPRVANSYAICLLTIGRATLPAPNYRVETVDTCQMPDRYESRCGLLKVLDRVTLDERLYAFHVTKFTVKDVRCYLKVVAGKPEYEALIESLEGHDLAQLPHVFGAGYLSWADMLPEVGGEIMRTLFDHNLRDLRERFDQMYDEHRDLFDAYVTAGLELPAEVKGLVSFSLSRAFTDVIIKRRGRWEVADYQRAVELQTMARQYGVTLDTREVEPLMTEDLLAEAQGLKQDLSPHRLANIHNILEVGRTLGLTLRRDLAENIVLEVLEEQVMSKIEMLSDVQKDFEAYRSILGILDWAEKLNFSKRRFEERLRRFEEKLTRRT